MNHLTSCSNTVVERAQGKQLDGCAALDGGELHPWGGVGLHVSVEPLSANVIHAGHCAAPADHRGAMVGVLVDLCGRQGITVGATHCDSPVIGRLDIKYSNPHGDRIGSVSLNSSAAVT